jgi:hypothetical protein
MVEATFVGGAKAGGWFWLGDVALGLLRVSVCGCFVIVPFFWMFAGGFGWVYIYIYIFLLYTPVYVEAPYAFNDIFNYL